MRQWTASDSVIEVLIVLNKLIQYAISIIRTDKRVNKPVDPSVINDSNIVSFEVGNHCVKVGHLQGDVVETGTVVGQVGGQERVVVGRLDQFDPAGIAQFEVVVIEGAARALAPLDGRRPEQFEQGLPDTLRGIATDLELDLLLSPE